MQIGKHDIRCDNIGSWPSKLHKGTIILVSALLLLLAYTLDFNRLIARKTQLQREERTLKSVLAQKQQVATQLPAYQEQFTISQRTLQDLINQFPAQTEVPTLIEDISKLGQIHHLSFMLLQPGETLQTNFYHECQIHIIVTGHFPDIARFIGDVATMQHLLTINDFQLQRNTEQVDPNNPVLTLDFIITTYQYAPKLAKTTTEPPAQIEPLPTLPTEAPYSIKLRARQDPFAPYINPATLAQRPDAGRTTEWLEKFPLDTLKMVGTISAGQHIWALIQSPNGLTKISVGQYIGQHAGRVIKITATSIVVEELIPEGIGQWSKRTIELNLQGKSHA